MTTQHKRLLGTLGLLAAFGVAACSSDPTPTPATDAGNDTPPTDTPPGDAPQPTDTPPGDAPQPTDTPPGDAPQPTDAPPGDAPAPTDGPTDAPADVPSGNPLCTTYCSQVTTNCTGANAQYANMAECLTYCNAARWPAGDPGAMAGNSLNCRIYHGGSPAMMDPGMHCPHAGPTGAGVCGSLMFRSEAAAMYRRVDRMGMPAVSTALIGSARKNAYNDVTGRTGMTGGMDGFVPDFVASLTGLHMALDRHLMAANLLPCRMDMMVGGLPECLGQNYATGATVASLVVPDDALVVTPANPVGFPNGRRLEDPVIDVTLAVLLLRLGGSCGMGSCTATTLASVPLNPRANDRMFLPDFPYLAPAHAAP